MAAAFPLRPGQAERVPLAAPGVASAALFAFLTSFDKLVISLFLTNAATQRGERARFYEDSGA
ncbi:hypothetical protein MMSR116_18165 [Methylobacterium mesophilicum SR1.6/6]|uniref:Uncharacterized protein n=1 Tax=Methylobacterium mesophilicum SR1.6/6 TaxID=908290 RepID=A0A6B9FMG4_9HYPH|nr:hypothetical protein MMSR116_18165 [Methylobacterium mesophilicum SR1.6/6]